MSFSVVCRELGGFPRRMQLISKSWLNPGLCLPWSGVWVPLEIPEAALPSARGWGRRWQRRRWVKSRSFLNYRGSGNEEQESEGLWMPGRACLDMFLVGLQDLPISKVPWAWEPLAGAASHYWSLSVRPIHMQVQLDPHANWAKWQLGSLWLYFHRSSYSSQKKDWFMTIN